MNLTADRIVEVTGGEVLRKAAGVFDSYAIDSRKVRPGGLFFAMRGTVTDGHLYVGAAAAVGAAGAVVEQPVDVEGLTLIRVPDSLRALQKLGSSVRDASSARFIGITGSAGKTSTKEFTAALLARKYRVYKSEGNLNSITGMPLSLLAMEQPECAVFEAGMSEPGEIAGLAALLRPHLRVLLNVNPVHLGQFPSIDAIADEKCSLLQGLANDDVVVYNKDDGRISSRVEGMAGVRRSFGFSQHADLRITEATSAGVRGQRAVLLHAGTRHAIRTSLCGKGNLYNIAAASSVAALCGLGWDEIAAGIESLQPYSQRGILLQSAGFDIYDDSYNSNPAALKFALEMVRESEGYRRKVVLLGDMLELGPDELQFHADAGKQAAAAGIHVLVAVGPRSKAMADAARAAGLPSVTEAENSEQAAQIAKDAVRAGDLVLVKGSRGMKMEAVVEALRKR